MKVIDLLNKIANGEEVPKKFRIKGSCFKDLYYEYNEKYNCYDLIGEKFKNGCYVFGYSELNEEIEILEEEKKIPEKIDVISWDKCIHDVTHKEKELAIQINKTQELLNQVIDYLKSKGE